VFLSDLSIKRPVLATMMIMALVVLGLFSYRRLGIDQFPDVEFPFLVIQTRYIGASPESVEREVTKKIEEQVNTVEGLKQIQSTSTEGFSTIIVQFNLGTKIMNAQADVRAKIDAIRQDLPKDIDPPVISRANPSDQPIFVLSVRGQGWALRDLTRLADEVVSRRIENISGVGSVTLVGGLKREIHVLLLPTACTRWACRPTWSRAQSRARRVTSRRAAWSRATPRTWCASPASCAIRKTSRGSSSRRGTGSPSG